MAKTLEEIWAGAQKGITAAALIFDAEGRVLLVKHSYGPLNWEVPGGAAEPHESPADTAVREVLEETRLVVKPERLTGIYYETLWHHPEAFLKGGEVVHFMFLCRAEPGAAPQPGEDGEITECAYWPVDGLPRPMSDFTIRRIQDGLGPCPALPTQLGERQWLT